MLNRLQAVLLCLRYVDAVAIGAWFVSSWCAQNKQVQKQDHRKKMEGKEKQSRYVSIRKNNFAFGNYRLRRAERWEYIATVFSKDEVEVSLCTCTSHIFLIRSDELPTPNYGRSAVWVERPILIFTSV